MTRAEVDPALAARFAASEFGIPENPHYRMDADHLFGVSRYSTKKHPEVVMRVHLSEVVAPDGPKFEPVARAYFLPDHRFPVMADVKIDPTKPWGDQLWRRNGNEVSIMVRELADGRDNISLWYEQGDIRIHASVSRLKDQLEWLSISNDRERVDTSLLKKIPRGKVNPDAFLASHGIVRDKKQGTISLTFGDWNVIGHNRVATEEVLSTLFPEELGADHFGAPANADGWSELYIFGAFGITISRVPSEVYSANS